MFRSAAMPHHQALDPRSPALNRQVVQLLRDDPAASSTPATLTRWCESVDERVQHCLIEWEALTGHGREACLQRMLEDSERAAALRQASPFAGALSNAERFAVLKAWREEQRRDTPGVARAFEIPALDRRAVSERQQS